MNIYLREAFSISEHNLHEVGDFTDLVQEDDLPGKRTRDVRPKEPHKLVQLCIICQSICESSP